MSRVARRRDAGMVPLVSGADVEAAAALLRTSSGTPPCGTRAGWPPRRRPGLPQVREPAAHRLVQDPRRLHADLPARPTPSARAASSPPAPATTRRAWRSPPACSAHGHGVHAGRRPAAEGRRHPQLRRGDPARRADAGPTRWPPRPSTPSAPGRSFIHPFEHPDIIAGQGTVGLEVLEQCPDVATIVVSAGGGGLLAGIAAAVKGRVPDVRVVAVQAEGGRGLPDSLAAGHPVPLATMSTMADGIAVASRATLTFAHCAQLVDEVRTVTEEDISRALLFCLERAKLVVEPAGVAAVAALLADPQPVPAAGGRGPLRRQRRPGAAAEGDPARHARGRPLPVRPAPGPRPAGGLAGLLGCAAVGANVIDVEHSRTTSTWTSARSRWLRVETRGPTRRGGRLRADAAARSAAPSAYALGVRPNPESPPAKVSVLSVALVSPPIATRHPRSGAERARHHRRRVVVEGLVEALRRHHRARRARPDGRRRHRARAARAQRRRQDHHGPDPDHAVAADAGRATSSARRGHGRRAVRARIGLSGQYAAVDENLTGAENL